MCKPIGPPQLFLRKTDIYIFVIGHIYYNYFMSCAGKKCSCVCIVCQVFWAMDPD